MLQVLRSLGKAFKSEDGATIIEYVLLAGLVTVVIFALFTPLRAALLNGIQKITDAINGITPGTSPTNP